jgi:hypothetical protein
MKPSIRAAIDTLDQAARSADLPTYTELTELILRAQGLMPHSSPARKSWVARVVEIVNRIHAK